MKRFLSVILAAVIMISAFCINAFAEVEATPKADALLDKLETEDEVLVTINSGSTRLFGFLPSDIKNTVAVKGNTIAYEYTAGFLKVRVIASEDGVYAFIPTLPFFYVKLDRNPLEGADIWQMVKDAANLTQGFIRYLESYNETVDGKEYYVEEYDDREFVTSKFYFDGEDLKILKVEDSSTHSIQYTYFDDITFEVDDSFFEVPSGAFNLSPILTGLILSIISAA